MNADTPPPAGRYIRPQDLDERATFGRRLAWGLESFAWDWIYWGPFSAMSPEAASNAGAALLRRLGPLSKAHRTAMRNLRLAFPDWSRDKVEETALASWETLGRISGELPHLGAMSPAGNSGRIQVLNGERLDAVRESGKPAVFVAAHLGNWEVSSMTVSTRPVDVQMTYRAANNPYIDRRIARARLSYGTQGMTPKGVGARELFRALSRGQSIGLMNDQKFNEGIPATFFGHPAMTAPGPTRLAMRFKAPIIAVSARRTGPARYTVSVEEPFTPSDLGEGEDAVAASVQRITSLFEARIREAPEQWFWMHNRWPKEAWVKAGVM
jgi:Kdo2-lipid IVA lauroyltransferase/acyltransferase